jgi:hypothetical protein
MERIAKGALILFQLIGVAIALTLTGSIAGIVCDPSGGRTGSARSDHQWIDRSGPPQVSDHAVRVPSN